MRALCFVYRIPKVLPAKADFLDSVPVPTPVGKSDVFILPDFSLLPQDQCFVGFAAGRRNHGISRPAGPKFSTSDPDL